MAGIFTFYPGVWQRGTDDDDYHPHTSGCDCESCLERDDDTLPPSDFLSPPETSSAGSDEVTDLREEIQALKDRVAALEGAHGRPVMVDGASGSRKCYYCGRPASGVEIPPRCSRCAK